MHRLSFTMTASDKDIEETKIVLAIPLSDLKVSTLALRNCVTTLVKAFKN